MRQHRTSSSFSPRERLARLLEASAGRSPETPAEQLRALLTELEIRVANMKGTGEEVLRIPPLMDRAYTLLQQLAQEGMDVKAEETRFENIANHLRAKAALFVREARKGGGLKNARARQSTPPPETHWWWYLDVAVAQARRQRVKRVVVLVVGIGLFLVAVGWLIQSFLPSNPVQRRIIDLQTSVDVAISNGDIAKATTLLEELRRLDPQNPEYAVELGVLYELQGDTQKATEEYAQARALTDEATFYKLRASFYLELGQIDKGLADAKKAVTLRPDDPEAYLYLGGAYEAKGDVHDALQAYEKGAELAQKQGNDQLLVILRVRTAYLLQRPPMGPEER